MKEGDSDDEDDDPEDVSGVQAEDDDVIGTINAKRDQVSKCCYM